MIYYCLIIDSSSPPYRSHWQIISISFGGSLILIVSLATFCLLKRKASSRLASEIAPRVQYDEIGTISFNSASIQIPTTNEQEVVTDDDGQVVEINTSQVLSLEHENSSDGSVQSISMSVLNGDDYEHPYQMINTENIEIHAYSTVCSN